ncbi:MAG: N-acetylglucosamine-6-phosphate deacetylase, partial [Armatimonadetes bacterium]|nr:N-acetylglucosamine-6-phosphate deacetylase [Armatimonadota bacterium]
MRVCGKLTSTGEVVTLTLERNKITHIHNGALSADIGDSSVWLSAGFNDIQLNGYGGVDFNLDAWGSASEVSHDLPLLFEKVAKSGTALLCPTLTTNSAEAICQALRNLSKLLNAERTYANRVVGIHVEGPYISEEDGPRGAHPLEHVRNPDWEEFQCFQEAAEGRIRILTLAPERPNALPFIEKVVESGVVIALGHTGADVSVIRDAVHAGATLATHLGNGA